MTCSRIATAFDPYLSVCLPIVKEESLELLYCPKKMHEKIEGDDGEVDYELQAMPYMSIPINGQTTVDDAKSVIISKLNLTDVTPKDLICVTSKHGQVQAIHKKVTKLVDIEENRFSHTIFYQVPRQSEESVVTELNFFKYSSRGQRGYSIESLDKAAPRFTTFERATTVMEVKRQVYE